MKPIDFPIGPQVSRAIAEILEEDPALSDSEVAEQVGIPTAHPAVWPDIAIGRMTAQGGFSPRDMLDLMAMQREYVNMATMTKVVSLLEEKGFTPEDLRKYIEISDLLLSEGANYHPSQLLMVADRWRFIKELAGYLPENSEQIIWHAADFLSKGLTEEQVKNKVGTKNINEVRQGTEGETPNGQTSGSDNNFTP